MNDILNNSQASIVMIGMGFAGTWQEVYFIESFKGSNLTIYEVEAYDKRRYGGIAYGEADEDHQVNIEPARQYGRFEDKLDYIKWLNETDRSKWPKRFREIIGDKIVGPGSDEYPRGLFQLYSEERLKEAKQAAKERGLHVNTVKITGQAVGIDESGERAIVHVVKSNGEEIQIRTDIWCAATGHGPALLPACMEDLRHSERIMADPWSSEVAARMAARPKNERILYIGNGMTTYDMYIRDEAQGHSGGMVTFSRNGGTHHAYARGFVFAPANVEIPESFSQATDIDELLYGKAGEYIGALEVFERLTRPAEQGGGNLHPEQVLARWEKEIPKLIELNRIPDADLRTLFTKKTVANTLRIGIAPKVGEAMNRASARGLEKWTGDIQSMEEKEDGIHVTLLRTDLGTPRCVTEIFGRVYSCLGMSNDFAHIQKTDPFWANVIQVNNFTQPHRFGGIVTEKNGKLPGSKFGYATGMPCSGMRVEEGWTPTISGAVVSIRTQFPGTAAAAIQQLAEITKRRTTITETGEIKYFSGTVESLLPTALREEMGKLMLNRRSGRHNTGFMVTEAIIGSATKGCNVFHVTTNGLRPVQTANGNLPLFDLSRIECAEPSYVALNDSWMDGCEKVDHDASAEANILGASGILTIDGTTLHIPQGPTTQAHIAFFGAQLIKLGADHVDFNVGDQCLALTRMRIGSTYASEYLLEKEKGGGMFLEHHDTPHFHMPTNSQARGHLVLGKRQGEQLLLSAFQIPYGYAIHTPPGVIHSDGLLKGRWIVGYTVSGQYSTVDIKANDGNPARIIVDQPLEVESANGSGTPYANKIARSAGQFRQ